jgi:membrane-bound lytic murein transglycosylase D
MAMLAALTGCSPAGRTRHLSQPPAAAVAPSLQPLPLASLKLPDIATATAADSDREALLRRVESVYQAGIVDYRVGNLEQAKEKFDQALALMLESNLDIQGNDQLLSQFNSMVDEIYDMELAALERGDTLSAHTYEPPPIESFAGLTFPVDPHIKARAQEELRSVHSDLPLVSNDLVDGVLTFLQKHGRNYVEAVLKGKTLYGPMIEDVLRQDGLPQDLIYLAAGESSFNPHALSRAGAKGIWQFMPGTGELYGLKINRWQDQREDPIKSTEAAARHLKDLYHTFGDWFLAMAAYDWSPTGVESAIQKTGYADFWKLRELHALPKETENYVPIFLATALIAKDPEAYGFQAVTGHPLEVDRVPVTVPTDLRLVAELIGHPVEELVRLNPELLTWTTPPNDPHFVLNLPAGTKDDYERLIAQIPENRRVWWRAYKVHEGDTLAGVARKFRVSTASLAEVNHIERQDPLPDGAMLVVPQSPGRVSSLLRVHQRMTMRRHYYRVRPGDTLQLVADRYDTTPYEIRRWNHLHTSRLTTGKTLLVYVPAPSYGSRSRRYRRRPSGHRTLVAGKPGRALAARRRKRSSRPRAGKTVGAGLEAAK